MSGILNNEKTSVAWTLRICLLVFVFGQSSDHPNDQFSTVILVWCRSLESAGLYLANKRRVVEELWLIVRFSKQSLCKYARLARFSNVWSWRWAFLRCEAVVSIKLCRHDRHFAAQYLVRQSVTAKTTAMALDSSLSMGDDFAADFRVFDGCRLWPLFRYVPWDFLQ